jgi:RNA chaperone Hfq
VQRVVRDGLSPGPLSHLSDDTLLLVVAASAAVLLGLVVAAAGARRRPGGNAAVGAALVVASPAMFVLNVWVNHTVADRDAAVPVALRVAGLLLLAPGVPRVGRWTFLAAAAAEKAAMTLFLVNGVILQGHVAAYDQFSVLLERDGQFQLVYKHAISTLQPPHPLDLGEHAGAEEPKE